MRARCAAPAAPPEFKSPDAFGVQYGLGSASDTSCPTGMVPMPIGRDLCERAAKVAGRPYGGNITVKSDDASMPVGCVWYSAGGSFYFNTYFSGANRVSAQPVCAGTLRLHGCMVDRGRMRLVCDTVCVCVCACVRACGFGCVCVCVCARARG